MSKFRKFLNNVLAIVGTGLLATAIYKSDITMSLLGLLVLDNSLNSLTLDKSEDKIKELEKTIKELKAN
jgi:hypothetical protein